MGRREGVPLPPLIPGATPDFRDQESNRTGFPVPSGSLPSFGRLKRGGRFLNLEDGSTGPRKRRSRTHATVRGEVDDPTGRTRRGF